MYFVNSFLVENNKMPIYTRPASIIQISGNRKT